MDLDDLKDKWDNMPDWVVVLLVNLFLFLVLFGFGLIQKSDNDSVRSAEMDRHMVVIDSLKSVIDSLDDRAYYAEEKRDFYKHTITAISEHADVIQSSIDDYRRWEDAESLDDAERELSELMSECDAVR